MVALISHSKVCDHTKKDLGPGSGIEPESKDPQSYRITPTPPGHRIFGWGSGAYGCIEMT